MKPNLKYSSRYVEEILQ